MDFTREDWTLFRSLTTLGQKAGVPLHKLGALVVKELVDNALDVGANVSLSVDGEWVVVSDDGPGIPRDKLATLFSIRRPLMSSKLLRLPQRGALGNGLRVVMGAVYASQGEIEVLTREGSFLLHPANDGHTTITRGPVWNAERRGTTIRIRLGKDIPGSPEDFLRYGKTAAAWAPLGTHFKLKTSPWFYDVDAMAEMCHAGGSQPLSTLLGLFQGIKPAFAASIPGASSLACQDVDRQSAKDILVALRGLSPTLKPTSLGAIGPVQDMHHAIERGTIQLGSEIPAELPYCIEVFAVSDTKDSIALMVNRTPVVGEFYCRRDKQKLAVFGCGLSHYVAVPKTPVALFINVTTPYMPITTDGKEPNLKPYLAPLSQAIALAAKKCKVSVRSASRGLASTQKDYIETCIDRAMDKASGNGKYRYSLRQLYYGVRPYLLDAFADVEGFKFDYNYFCSCVTQIESDRGHDMPGMYRDARGMLYHPHTRQEIALGTLGVEQYARPAWTFNKILFIEKGGLVSILREDNWPERNDCALMTTQGFASRAARDVIDLIGDTDEDIYFFCLHDADASGTKIYESLIEETKARGARRVHVVNLGLEPEEAVAMGLQVEVFREEYSGKKLPVANYVSSYWTRWLQWQRVELNAMTTPEFIQWLDGKMAEYAGKIVPPKKVLNATYEAEGEKAIRADLTRRILEDADIDGKTSLVQSVMEMPDDLAPIVRNALVDEPEVRWDKPVEIRATVDAEALVETHYSELVANGRLKEDEQESN